MPRCDPLPHLDGDVFVIGGGPSLTDFDWSQIEGRNTIGCNQAFDLGSSICKICVFGDEPFWTNFYSDLWKFDGWVVTNKAISHPPHWLHVFGREDEGLCNDGKTLAWNFNTGALATNLALTLGAERVLLLGMDMGGANGATHWHRRGTEIPQAEHYTRFAGGFANVVYGLANGLFPNSRVVNVTNGSSGLRCFPILSFKDMGLK